MPDSLALRGGREYRRTLVRLAACALLCACSVPVVYAQQPKARPVPTRRAPLPTAAAAVATTQAKSGVANTPSASSKFQTAAPQVIAVVHRMSGWKLRTLLTPADAHSASSFDENFVRTNIVAGFILPDGRSVIARLPQAEAEMLTLSAAFRRPLSSLSATTDDAELLLVRPDGVQFNARFIGLDASTGLSLLESDKPLHAPAAEATPHLPPVAGQRVRLIAPVRAATPAAVTAPAITTRAITAPAATVPATAAPPAISSARPEDAPVGDEGFIYMNMSEEAGQLREVKRSPSGKALEMTLEAERISPEWAGGVALSETGTLVGILEESDTRATRLMSAETVRGAARRVRARCASVPQPWLGARGDTVAFAPLEQFLARGWRPEQARLLVSGQSGVLLTSVAPGTPAALAGLRPGDVISRIGQHDVRSIEDMSSMIKELGGNTLVKFTVLRAASAPLKLAVRLSESPSPGLDTARAELRAVQSELRAKQSAVNSMQQNVRRFESELRRFESELERLQPVDASPASQKMQEALRQVRTQYREALERVRKISADLEQMRTRMAEAEARYRTAIEAYSGLAVKPLLSFGLEAVRISPATKLPGGAQSPQQQSGLLVMSVRPGSAAARSRIQTGDIIESINGQIFSETNWNFNFSNDFDTDLSLGIFRSGEKLSFNLSRQNSPQ